LKLLNTVMRLKVYRNSFKKILKLKSLPLIPFKTSTFLK